ncbi:MAG TPA: hypothetical protein VJM32_05900 [Candidatus Saccharimonadales bacterium]|nr:hypothetical protein [Candidatus Saccharimonadales bacterium]
MSPAIKVLLGTIIVSTAAIIGALMLPLPSTWQGAAVDFHLALAGSTVAAVLHMSAAVLFVMSLGAYKAELRFAYGIIAFSIVLTALGTLQLPLLDALGLMNSAWAVSGLITLPFLVAGLGVYIGARGFAKLVGVQTILAKASVVLPAVVVLITLSSFLPHAAISQTEVAFDVSNSVLLWTGFFYLTAALIMLKARRQLGAHYVHAAAWLALGLSGSATIIGTVLFGIFFLGDGNRLDITTDILTLATASIYVKAGYMFYKTKEY